MKKRFVQLFIGSLFWGIVLGCLVGEESKLSDSKNEKNETRRNDLRAVYETEQKDFESTIQNFGIKSPDTGTYLGNLILLSRGLSDFDESIRYEKLFSEHIRQVYGDNDPTFADTKLSISRAEEATVLPEDKQLLLSQSAQDELEVYRLVESAETEEAIDRIVHSLHCCERLWGENDRDTHRAMLYLATLQHKYHPEFSLDSTRDRVLSELLDDRPDYIRVLQGFAGLFFKAGDFTTAERILLKVQSELTNPSQQQTNTFAETETYLGVIRYQTGDHQTANRYLSKALAIFERNENQEPFVYSTCLQTLGLVKQEMREWELAKKYLERSLVIDSSQHGKESTEYLETKLRLAWVIYRSGEPLEAYRLAQEALEVIQTQAQPNPFTEILGLTVLAKGAQATSRFDEAESAFSRCLSLWERSQDPASVDLNRGVLLNNLAKLSQAKGEYASSANLYRQAIQMTQAALARTAVFQSDRQQIAFRTVQKYQLDNYVSCGLQSNWNAQECSPEAVYENVLQWKGAVFSRQRVLREQLQSPETQALLKSLQGVSSQLSKLSSALPAMASERRQRNEEIVQVTETKESIERELALKTSAQIRSTNVVSIADLKTALPSDGVLIDYIQLQLPKPVTIAFVIQKASPVRAFNLGNSEAIAETAQKWIESIRSKSDTYELGSKLRQQIWEPFEQNIQKESIVLISTDGMLGQIPFNALPGQDPNRYLIEEQRIALIPAAQVLPLLFNKFRDGLQIDPQLMTLGDIDYGTAPDEGTQNSGRNLDEPSTNDAANIKPTVPILPSRKFGRLNETSKEVREVTQLFTKAFAKRAHSTKDFLALDASEENFRIHAPEMTHIHLATHGYFVPEVIDATGNELELFANQRATTDGRPMLLDSGIALANANLSRSTKDEDGILTIAEVQAMNLTKVDLVVLSACESGLGLTTSGEGVLGFQRAFHIAGAKSSIASLWNVGDLETRNLMEKFYRNLWEENLNKIDSLRDAQLQLMRMDFNGPRSPDRAAIVDLPGTTVQQKSIGIDRSSSSIGFHARRHPYYWSAFQLSGDWQ